MLVENNGNALKSSVREKGCEKVIAQLYLCYYEMKLRMSPLVLLISWISVPMQNSLHNSRGVLSFACGPML